MKKCADKKRRISFLWLGITILLFFFSGISDAVCAAEESTGETCSVYYAGERISEEGYVLNGTPYIPAALAQKYGDFSKVTLDTTAKKIQIDLTRQNILMADDVTTAFVKANGGLVYIPLRQIEGNLYVPMNSTEQFLKLSASVKKGSIYLVSYSGSEKMARINTTDAPLQPSVLDGDSDSVTLPQDQLVFVLSETPNYYQVATPEGEKGYLLKSLVTISEVDLSKVDFYAPKKQKFVRGKEKINLAWQYVAENTPAAPTSKKGGLDILAPTWFDQIVNGGGAVENNGDLGYTDSAHAKGYQVWATITNNASTKGSTAYTTSVFADSTLMKKTVAQYLFYSCLYDVNGINIDYEDVKDSDASGLVAFTALLRTYTERQGLTLSIDTLVPKPWTLEYDMDALAKYVDFLAVMAYDEHYSSSPAAGSIASLPWVEEALEDTLSQVPKSKLLLGIPMYTRVWVVDASGAVIRNPSATMPYIQNLISEKGLAPVWLEKEQQYFVSYPNGSYTDKIWVEDQRSIATRLALVNEYGIAGSACWQYSQASEDIWDVFDGMLHKGKNVKDYSDPY